MERQFPPSLPLHPLLSLSFHFSLSLSVSPGCGSLGHELRHCDVYVCVRGGIDPYLSNNILGEGAGVERETDGKTWFLETDPHAGAEG